MNGGNKCPLLVEAWIGHPHYPGADEQTTALFLCGRREGHRGRCRPALLDWLLR